MKFFFEEYQTMKFAATVILYYPDEDVLKNIKSYIQSVEKLYIIDNSENPVKEIADAIKQLNNTVYLHDGDNMGIAARLNQASDLAIKDGYEWLLTMDQDSFFQEEVFINYLECLAVFDEKENVGMFGISYYEKSTETNVCNALSVNHLITSGSFLNLKLLPVIGGFDEKLFIDDVDFEYCLRSVSLGFKIIRFTNIFLDHQLGKVYDHRSLKTNKLTSRTLHTPVRLYYMTRNFLYVQSKYRTAFKEDIIYKRKALLNRFKNNILYNKKRFTVIKYIIKGVSDYRNSKMGKERSL